MARIRAAWIRRRTRRRAGAHGHRCLPAARRAATRASAWFAHHATPTRHLPCVAPAVALAAFSSYKSSRNGSKNQIDLIDRPSPADHNVSICNDSSAPHRYGCPCRVAHRPMTPSHLVPVAGVLARPRVAPLDHVPSFGRDWIFRDAPGTQPGKHCVATLATSCIDVDRPHRACHWEPLPIAVPAPISAGSPIALPAAAGRRSRRIAGGARDRRARYALCWSIGALGIIGWLIATHEPIAGLGRAYAIQTADGAPDHATSSSGTVRVATVQPHTSSNAAPQRKMAAPVATTAGSRQATHHVTRHPASLRPRAMSDMPRTATASSPRSNGKHATAAPARRPTMQRLAARPPVRRNTVDTRARDRLATAPRAIAHSRDTLDDPLTLIAMASALRATEPARATHAFPVNFDWTTQLSHRRLTDTPDAFAR
ncbi:hypothetical protein BLA9940_06374 [Burkholderia aenigmatica]|uniref:hypothetical protein n=2 Tax=Burkholderia cepacia complex TaxID=87882 RepID=UPI001454287A|nr:hypothetical protein [Burkholderia aenigmatica]VWD04240.1 hypothetical protein BLA9940_06374 [Burkholderia aenigmatica]